MSYCLYGAGSECERCGRPFRLDENNRYWGEVIDELPANNIEFWEGAYECECGNWVRMLMERKVSSEEAENEL